MDKITNNNSEQYATSEQILDSFKRVKINLYFKVVQITLVNLLLFLSFGYIIDAQIGSRPWGMVVGAVLAFVTTQTMLTKYVKKVSKEEFDKSKPRKNNYDRNNSSK